MRFKFGFILLVFFLFGFNTSVHEFHVGITEIHYSEQSKTYEIAIRLFTDDLEKAILESEGIALKLDSEKEVANADSLVMKYVLSNFDLSDNKNRALALSPIGRETELDLTWIYIESEKTKPQEALSVTNKIFMETFDDQTHIVHLSQLGERESLYLHRGKTKDTY